MSLLGKMTNSGKKGVIIAAVGVSLVAVIAVLAVTVVRLSAKNNETDSKENKRETVDGSLKRGTVATPDNIDSILESMANAELVEPGYYSTSMTNEWHFADGDAVSEDAFVENLPENTNDIYFDVVLAADESKVIYASPVIPRGSQLEQIALDEHLDAGTYDCVLIYHLIDEDQNTVSTLRIGITVFVQS